MNGEQIVKVADISMSTNNEQGLTLTATSGSLTKDGGTAIPYEVTSVADAASSPGAAAFTTTSGQSYTVGTTGSGSAAVDLYVRFTPAGAQDAGTYTGEITLTVSDNP
jgi:hypothetical protein